MSRSLDATRTRALVDEATFRARGWSRTDTASWADLAPVGLLAADRDGSVVFANAAWRDLSGLDPGESTGHGWLVRLSHDGGTALLALLREVCSDGVPRTVDQQLLVDASKRWVRWWVKPIGAEDAGEVVMAVADVELDHAEKEALLFRARHDPLTGLVNRGQFVDLTEHALRGHRRHPSHLAVLYVDLDDFKAVNDEHGHAQGDSVLVAVAAALGAAVRPEDALARIGGDEFAVMCDRLDEPADAAAIADRIRGAFTAPLVADGVAWDLSVSVGVAHADGAHESAEAILDRADRAMYAEKRSRAVDDPSDGSRRLDVTAAGSREA